MTNETASAVVADTSVENDYVAFETARKAELSGTPVAKTEEKPSEAAAENDGTPETGSDSETDENKQQEENEGEKPKKGGFQKKIDKLTARNRALEDRLAVLEKSPAAAAPAAAKKAPDQNDFDDFDKYEAARIDYLAEQKAEAKLEEARKQEHQREAEKRDKERQGAFAQRVEAVKAVTPDFVDVLKEADAPSDELAALLLDSEHGARMFYDLAKADDMERLNGLDPKALAREFGRLEAKYLNSPETPKTKVSSAPKPPAIVGGGAGPVKADPNDYAAWEKQRNAEVRKR